jgi:hypothetical protein
MAETTINGFANTFRGMDNIPTNTDLNNITTMGFYTLPANNTYTNLPSGRIYGMLVLRSRENHPSVWQIGVSSDKMYMRVRSDNTTWNSWVSVN